MAYDLFVGMDESNNGRAFEIHTAVFSLNPQDGKASEVILPKIRAHKHIFNRLKNRTYSFLLLTDTDKSQIPKHERAGIISSSLLEGELDWDQIDNLKFYLDGDRSTFELDFMKEKIASLTHLNEDNIKIKYGGKFDQWYPVVNIADQMAHYLFRKGIYDICEHKDRKPLIY
jgi:hypothetical protein